MSNEATFELMWLQTLTGDMQVLEQGLPAAQALATLQRRLLEDLGMGGTVFLRPEQNANFLVEVEREVERAREDHAPLHSAHEAYAVILEELDEFKAEVWKKRAARDRAAMHQELVQLAAMCMRAVEDLAL